VGAKVGKPLRSDLLAGKQFRLFNTNSNKKPPRNAHLTYFIAATLRHFLLLIYHLSNIPHHNKNSELTLPTLPALTQVTSHYHLINNLTAKSIRKSGK
jgi:hypothetical protein